METPEKYSVGQHPNSISNLTYHGGRPATYGEVKKRRELTVTQEGWDGMQEVVKEAGCSSVSELIEKLGRRQLRVVDEGDSR